MVVQKGPEQVVEEAIVYLRDLRYSEETVKEYKVAWTKILRYAQKRGVRHYSQSLIDDFKRSRKLLSFTKRYCRTPKGELYRAVRVLEEFAGSGVHTRRTSYRKNPIFPPFVEKGLLEIQAYMLDELNYSPVTVYHESRWFKKYLLLRLSKPGFSSWRCLRKSDASDFLHSLSHLALSARDRALQSVKSVLKALFVLGKVPAALYESTPKFQKQSDGPLRPIWPVGEVEAFLAVVDRATPIGKRDYAVFLLAARLGLRAGDIRTMTLDSIIWEQSRLELVQRKTQRALSLPLPADVGEAIIDYVRNARPSSPFYREIFLRHYAPFAPLCRGRNFCYEVRRYRELARLPKMPGMSLHSLRHTLATRMLDHGVPVQDIAAVLGHGNMESTRPYLRVSLPALRQAALEPDEEVAYA